MDLPMFRATVVLLLVMGSAGEAIAQTPAPRELPAVFAELQGRWTGSGVLLGRPAEFHMHWEAVEGGFVRLSFRNAWVNEGAAPTPVLSSVATYYPVGASAQGVWLDDRPQRIRLEAALTDSTLVTEWTADSEQGRTEYVVRSPDTVLVRDFVYVEGTERLFAEATYHPDVTVPTR